MNKVEEMTRVVKDDQIRDKVDRIIAHGNEGGAAFPCPMSEQTHTNQDSSPFQTGMTLRDYFAGQALVGITRYAAEFDDWFPELLAKKSYEMADAMIAARGV